MRIRADRNDLIALPAHFQHAEGNFQFCDPVSRILFSGDLGVSLLKGKDAASPATSLAPLLPAMEKFHRRHMVSNKVMRLWADRVSRLRIEMIVPQHGAPLVGAAVGEFIAWAREPQCGIDLMRPLGYRVPV
jgi:flavorubredoxin